MAYMKDSAGRRLDDSIAERVRPATIVYHGDSLTADGGYARDNKALTGASNRSYLGLGFSTWAQIHSSHRLQILRNTAKGGWTTAQILAAIDDVISLAPGYVHDLSGTNNIGGDGQDALVAQGKLDKIEMWDRYEEAGIRVLVGTLFPVSSYTGNQRAKLDDFNEWIRQQAHERENLILVDYFSALAAPQGGYYVSTYNRDSTHTNNIGGYKAGIVLARVINQIAPPRPFLSSAQGDTLNLVTAGRFYSGGAGAVPTTWSTPNLAGGAFSKVARTDGVPGDWQQIVVANGSNGQIQHNITVNGTTIQVGDYIEAAIEFELSNLDTGAAAATQSFGIKVQSYNGTTATDMMYAPYFASGSTSNFPSDARSGVLITPPLAIPSGTTTLLYQVFIGGGGTYKIDRATVRNLTKLGLPTDLG
jgi:phage protein U